MALEVGSGRGGGASYIVRRFQPRSFVGLELSRTAVDFCRAAGHFIYAGMRYLEEVPAWKEQLKASGLRLLREEEITANVASALRLDSERKLALIDRCVPGIFKPFFRNFTGLKGLSLALSKPKTGERVYLAFMLQK